MHRKLGELLVIISVLTCSMMLVGRLNSTCFKCVTCLQSIMHAVIKRGLVLHMPVGARQGEQHPVDNPLCHPIQAAADCVLGLLGLPLHHV